MTHVSLVGTPCYTAPETFEGSAGKSSDVWGFRVVYLELCGGRRAWGAESVIIMSYILLKEVPLFSHLNSQQQEILQRVPYV